MKLSLRIRRCVGTSGQTWCELFLLETGSAPKKDKAGGGARQCRLNGTMYESDAALLAAWFAERGVVIEREVQAGECEG